MYGLRPGELGPLPVGADGVRPETLRSTTKSEVGSKVPVASQKQKTVPVAKGTLGPESSQKTSNAASTTKTDVKQDEAASDSDISDASTSYSTTSVMLI